MVRNIPFRLQLVLIASMPLAVFVGGIAQGTGNSPAGVVNLAGKSIDPFQEAKPKVVVLVFVRADCPISNRYAPEIQRLSAAYRGKAEFFLVYVDKKESADAIRRHNREYRYELPALRDLQHSLVKLSGAQITPEVAVFGASRRLLYHGRIDNLYEDFSHTRKSASTHELDEAIRAAIAGRTPAAGTVPAVGCYISDVE